jgi:hypothetical protein
MNRYCLALVVLIAGAIVINAVGQGTSAKALEPAQEKGAAKADPAATKLMSDTHDSWAHWEDFPGFTGDLEVNLDGKISKGQVQVSRDGKVKVQVAVAGAQAFAEEVLVSLVGHRLGQRLDVNAPCAFVDDVTTHPLGRAVHVLKDDPGTTYRIRDREVVEVNRRMGNVRYTHIILENRPNKDKKHLTVSFVANMWDAKTGALRRTDTNHQSWERIGNFDLPVAVTRIRAGADNVLEVGTLKLSNLRVGMGSSKE